MDGRGLNRNVVNEGEIDHGAWLRARAESRFVGSCPECGDYLQPLRPEDVSGRTDYTAQCRAEGCNYAVLAPGGRVLTSGYLSRRAAMSGKAAARGTK